MEHFIPGSILLLCVFGLAIIIIAVVIDSLDCSSIVVIVYFQIVIIVVVIFNIFFLFIIIFIFVVVLITSIFSNISYSSSGIATGLAVIIARISLSKKPLSTQILSRRYVDGNSIYSSVSRKILYHLIPRRRGTKY